MNEQVNLKLEFNSEYWLGVENVIEKVLERILEKKHIIISTPTTQQEEPLCKVEQIADDLNVTRQTIHDWKRKGLIPFERMGGRVYFRKSQVRAALKKIESIPLKNR